MHQDANKSAATPHYPRMRRSGLLCALGVMLAVQGCMVVPASKKTTAGTEIDSARLEFIQPGVTTRSEVIKQLGPTHAIFEEIRVLAYSWDARQGYMVWVNPYGPDAGAQMFGRSYLLLVEWDEQERVRRLQTVKRGVNDTVRSEAVAWARAGSSPVALALPTRFAHVSVPSGKSVIHIFRPGGFEVPYVAVRVSVNNKEIADLRSKECVSLITEAGSHSITLRPHSLATSSGPLSVEDVTGTVVVDARVNQATYVQVKVPAGRGKLDPLTRIVPEGEALPTLSKLTPW